MVRDEFLGAAGFNSGGGGGGNVDPYPPVALVITGNTPLAGIYRVSNGTLGSKYLLPQGYGSLGTSTNPNFSLGFPTVVCNRSQTSLIYYNGTIFGNASSTFNPAVASNQSLGTYYSNMPINTSTSVQASTFNTAGDVALRFSIVTGTTAYRFNSTSGWGAAFSAPVTPPPYTGTGAGADSFSTHFANSDSAAIVSANLSPFLNGYLWDNTTGWGSKFANPSPAITAKINFSDGPILSASKEVLAWVRLVGINPTITYIDFYRITNSGFVYINTYNNASNPKYLSELVFSATGGSVVFGYYNDTTYDVFSWTDSGGVGNKIDTFTQANTWTYPVCSVSTDGAVFSVIYATTYDNSNNPSNWYIDFYNYSDSTGIGSKIGNSNFLGIFGLPGDLYFI